MSKNIELDEETSDAVNRAVLTRIDPAVTKICAKLSFAAVYRFNPHKQSWERREIEGPCFLLERNEAPYFRLFVMNRINETNFSQDITSTFECKIKQSYIMFKDSHATTSGVHNFYTSDEVNRERFVQSIKDRVKLLAAGKIPKDTRPSNPPVSAKQYVHTTPVRVRPSSETPVDHNDATNHLLSILGKSTADNADSAAIQPARNDVTSNMSNHTRQQNRAKNSKNSTTSQKTLHQRKTPDTFIHEHSAATVPEAPLFASQMNDVPQMTREEFRNHFKSMLSDDKFVDFLMQRLSVQLKSV